ncbi:hypothetical protein DNTS_031762 [Danionella cerebrum]|uniref:Uncharacterized protein n=1 Tax=Danionella cerebrum TaxID=2873325 RepID=A0A553MYT3_9TELE|nr:hypothetical protein DNTS_031762 [Danionella translucida]
MPERSETAVSPQNQQHTHQQPASHFSLPLEGRGAAMMSKKKTFANCNKRRITLKRYVNCMLTTRAEGQCWTGFRVGGAREKQQLLLDQTEDCPLVENTRHYMNI